MFSFGSGKADGNEGQRELLGGKGANLHGMTLLGLPVPPGFTISTEVCTYFYGNKGTYPGTLEGQVRAALSKVEKLMGRTFGAKVSSPSLSSLRGAGIHAWDDGYYS